MNHHCFNYRSTILMESRSEHINEHLLHHTPFAHKQVWEMALRRGAEGHMIYSMRRGGTSMLIKKVDNILLQKKAFVMKTIHFALLILFLTMMSIPAFAEIRAGSYSVSPFIGGFLFEGNQDLEHRPTYGLRAGYNFTKNWGAEALLGYVRTNYKVTDSTTDVFNYRLEGLYHFWPQGRLAPFLAAGLGLMTIKSKDDAVDRNRAAFDYGAGVKYSLTDWLALRADVRHVLTFGSVYNNLEYTVGLTFSFGGNKVASSQAVPETMPAGSSALSTPLNLAATAVSDSQINLSWNGTNTATGYRIYRDGSYRAATKETSAPDTGLAAGTLYCYTVSATDDTRGESARSNEACATTLTVRAGQGEQKQEAAAAAVSSQAAYALEDIHFDFDKFNLKPEAREILDRHAAWLNQNSAVKLSIIVEGHTDERGTAEYNMALGNRRADAATQYLIKLGVDASRITIISFGFERPVDPRHNEEAWAKNRRAHLVITGGADQRK
jgi:OmpA-OmpF porin, OOP family